MPDYSRINGRKVVGEDYRVIEAIKEYGMTACIDVINGHMDGRVSGMSSSIKSMKCDLRRLVEYETSGKVTKITKPKTERTTKGKKKHLSSEEFDAFKKPGLRQNRLIYIVDKIPALSKFEDPEAIYVAFPDNLYIARSNFLFLSPCYRIKNIYYIKTKKFEWGYRMGQRKKILINSDKILEELVKSNNIKRTIDHRRAAKS
jgi:hypothetical protein